MTRMRICTTWDQQSIKRIHLLTLLLASCSVTIVLINVVEVHRIVVPSARHGKPADRGRLERAGGVKAQALLHRV